MIGSGAKTGEKRLKLDAVAIGITRGPFKFEIFVDPDLAFRYRRGESVPIEDILKSYTIYEDAKRGQRASEQVVLDTFGTLDVFTVASEILRRGEFKLTVEQRNQLVGEKTDAIVTAIAKRAMNPQTGHPHPPERIRQAMQEAKVRVDPFISVDEQIQAVIKALRVVIPISFDSVKLRITIPAAYSGKGSSIVIDAGLVRSESWNQDGSWTALVEVPVSERQRLLDELSRLTKGQAHIEVVR
ncbi:MAG: ribosome assembly factor SBDS [Candidatus Thorarchaeota archaeon]